MENLRGLAFNFSDFLISVFNKEAIAVFCIFCVLIFAIAAMAALWAFDNGEFRDIEGAKFEMLED
tara:strand:+ start:590 stop:784 length:195 start_codon:yes stop_codon:yes gene_type:complete